jgi:hypothetical protein
MFILLIICIVFQLFSAATWITVGGVFLFTFTYIGIGFTNILNLDGKGLGWYCLLVALITPFFSHLNFSSGDWRFGIIWLIWGVLWFVFFLILGLGKKALASPTFGWIIILVGVFTLWIPGYAMLRGWW